MPQLPTITLIGRPNVGKSSLFNALLRRPGAITAREAGTTRDSIYHIYEQAGKQAKLVDTAGLFAKDPSLNPEAQAAIAAQQTVALKVSDLILLVVDGSTLLTQSDRQAAKQALRSGKPVALIVNKSDKAYKDKSEFLKLGIKRLIFTSATTRQGLGELAELLEAHLVSGAEPAPNRGAIAIVGRPNVGKSSLFNALVGGPAAVVGDKPHTTRDANYQTAKLGETTYQLIDTGGIRRPGARTPLEKFSFERTRMALAQAEMAVLVMDATEPSTALDQKIAGIAKDLYKGLIIIVNKWDLIDDKESARLSLEHKLRLDFAFAWWAPLVFISATTGQNIAKVGDLVKNTLQNRQRVVNDDRLRQILTAAMAAHPVPRKIYGQPTLKNFSQVGTQPPHFELTGASLDNLHWSYRRYLESQLRDQEDFSGTAIRIDYKDKHQNGGRGARS